ncbi:UDP-glucuronosyltransferase [Meloidogyne graminicola]|uniref:UDP-glucuronosyltransferase n=1 Tax=Meloidogyne graminicola TaxID=189291 RepID=A0A8S9ZN43_9BILA|nr:UDP-glucuronosyltransferase [Meloidogyne graminicola]
MKFYLLIFTTFILINLKCEGAKFLFTFFHDNGSHFGSMLPLMEMLVDKGHSVTFLNTIPIDGVSPKLKSIRFPLPRRTDEEWKNKLAYVLWHSRLTSSSLGLYYTVMDNLLGIMLQNGTDKIVEIINEDWDFIVIDDLFWSFGFALTTLKHKLWELNGKQFNQPHIIVYATAATSLISAESVRSVGRNWVSRVPMCPPVPTDESDVYSPNKFSNRILAFYENIIEVIHINYLVPHLMPNMKVLGLTDFSWSDFYSRTSLQFADSMDRIGWPMAVGKEMINIGAHCKKVKILPKKFAEFVEAPESKGTIYAAFGTNVDWSRAPKYVYEALLNAFNRFKDYRVIFVYNGPELPQLGKHVLLTKWAPQLEILAHKKTKVFISHGGNKSLREALCSGIPLIVMPVYAEQAHSAHVLLAMGHAPVINKFNINEENVFQTINEVI